MIYSVTGKPMVIDENTVAISNGAVAYEVVASTNTIYNLSRKTENVTLLTYLYVREDEMRLFGFENLSEKALFLNLISVSGIGPKAASQIILDLQGVLALEEVQPTTKLNKAQEDAKIALKNLGFKVKDIEDCLKKIDDDTLKTEEYITLVLRTIRKG